MASESKSPKAGGKAAREARLAAALRENLKRRKDQARAREADGGEPSPEPADRPGGDPPRRNP